ncbi:MAG: hypothetical protein CMB28_01485 [Euryarchaeota archaeon]|nr:hypothetical protein [Euryarchaeota archaeon]
MRFKVAFVLLLMILSTTISTANPGGKGDSVRSRDCAGSCHASSSTNGISEADLDIQYPDQVYAGLLMEIETWISFVEVSSNNMVGVSLLVNDEGAKDLPGIDGWEVVTDPNGGTNNYVEIVDSFSLQNTVRQTWTLRAPSSPGVYELYVAVQHGTPDGGVAMTGISDAKQVTVGEVPENLPRLSPEWEPVNTRLIGEETEITLQLLNTDTAFVELKGSNQDPIPVVDNKFTIPAAVNPGTVEWRVIMIGEGPTQQSPWFRITAQEPGWEVDEFALYLQGFALFILCVGLVILQRPRSEGIESNKYDNTEDVTSQFGRIQESSPVMVDQSVNNPPIPEGGLPEGWTMEQWEYYGQEHLDSLARGGQQ